MMRTFRELDSVVLLRDLPEDGLRAGDLGAVVQVYAPETFEVEFVTTTGRTPVVRTLSAADVRAMTSPQSGSFPDERSSKE